MSNKRLYGQYFTVFNPFETVAFYRWLELIPNLHDQTILEPFAGANNIPAMIINNDILPDNQWECYDIEPSEYNACEQFKINKGDTIQYFPIGFKVAITNPPYLSKNSASRRKLKYPKTEYDDIYKLCLHVMLTNCDYVAAIIPETFITSQLFHDRLFAVVSLTCQMFDDTNCPVCLALFIPKHDKSFYIYRMNENLGLYSTLKSFDIPDCETKVDWKFNDPFGSIGIDCCDSTKGSTI